MKLWTIVADTGPNGAHEADCVYSIWTTEEGAKAELQRLTRSKVMAGCYNGQFHVVEVEADMPSNESISS